MPELPDILVYLDRLASRIVGEPLCRVRIASPFVLQSVDPPIEAVAGKRVRELRRLGKRIVIGCEESLFVVIHLMIAGRLRWKPPDATINRKLGLAAFDFPRGTLLITEASTKKRASIHLVRGEAALAAHDPGGLDVLTIERDAFGAALHAENHTLKRALTDPRLFSGIGNAYSDEILHRARLSPVKLTQRLNEEEISALHRAAQETLREWIERLGSEVGDGFPDKVTAFHPQMAVHGRYRKPCPVCGSPVQRIAYAASEAHYCATCQTGGRLLADRAFSRLLRGDWPRTLEELEERFRPPPDRAAD